MTPCTLCGRALPARVDLFADIAISLRAWLDRDPISEDSSARWTERIDAVLLTLDQRQARLCGACATTTQEVANG